MLANYHYLWQKIVNLLLLFGRYESDRAVVNYINKNSNDNIFRCVAAHLESDIPTKEDIIRAMYCYNANDWDDPSDVPYHVKYLLKMIAQRYKISKYNVIIDIGCETGLVGEVLRSIDFCGTPIGFDISDKMLLRAKENGLYTEIYCCSIDRYIDSIMPGSFDSVFVIGLGSLLDSVEMSSLLETLFKKVANSGSIIFNLPTFHDIRLNGSTVKIIEPVLKKLRVRYRSFDAGTDAESRRFYYCRR